MLWIFYHLIGGYVAIHSFCQIFICKAMNSDLYYCILWFVKVFSIIFEFSKVRLQQHRELEEHKSEMTTRKVPEFVMDLMSGFCKRRFKGSSIAISLLKLIGLFFWICVSKILFTITFSYDNCKCYQIQRPGDEWIRWKTEEWIQLRSFIGSYIVIPNRKCYKVNFMIGANVIFEISMGDNHVNVKSQGRETLLTMKNGEAWKIDRNSGAQYIEMMFTITRNTICVCSGTDGNVEVVCRNVQEINYLSKSDSKSIWCWQTKAQFATNPKLLKCSKDRRLFGEIKREWNDGYYNLSLSANFNYNSNQNVSIDVHGVGEEDVNIWSSKHANQACGRFGFCGECCDIAGYELRNKV